MEWHEWALDARECKWLIYDIDPWAGHCLIEYSRDGRNSGMEYTFFLISGPWTAFFGRRMVDFRAFHMIPT